MEVDHSAHKMYTSRARDKTTDPSIFVLDSRSPGVRRGVQGWIGFRGGEFVASFVLVTHSWLDVRCLRLEERLNRQGLGRHEVEKRFGSKTL